MIEIKDLSISYKKLEALRNVSLSIDKGETVALVGQNGAGKSSLLNAVINLIKPSGGAIDVSGTIGWMPELSTPDSLLTVSEFLTFTGSLKLLKNDQLEKEVSRVIKMCSLDDKADQLCGNLSKGLMQRVMFAGAIIGDPDILVLDEPSSGLDPLFQKQMISLISDLTKNKTVILSTHNISEIELLGSRVIVLKNGEVSFDSSISKGDIKSCYEYF